VQKPKIVIASPLLAFARKLGAWQPQKYLFAFGVLRDCLAVAGKPALSMPKGRRYRASSIEIYPPYRLTESSIEYPDNLFP